MKCVYKLFKSSKLIYKAAFKGKEFLIIVYLHIFNLVIVIPSNIGIITIIINALNMVKKDKEEHSYITVFNNIKLIFKDTYLDYKPTNKDLD